MVLYNICLKGNQVLQVRMVDIFFLLVEFFLGGCRDNHWTSSKSVVDADIISVREVTHTHSFANKAKCFKAKVGDVQYMYM